MSYQIAQSSFYISDIISTVMKYNVLTVYLYTLLLQSMSTRGKELLDHVMGCSGFPDQNSQRMSIQDNQGYSDSGNGAQGLLTTLSTLITAVIAILVLV